MSRNRAWWLVLVGVALLAAPGVSLASAPASSAAAPSDQGGHGLAAMVDAARARNRVLQSQVARMERQTAAQQQELHRRDAEIAALRQKLRAAGAPVPSGSGAH